MTSNIFNDINDQAKQSSKAWHKTEMVIQIIENAYIKFVYQKYSKCTMYRGAAVVEWGVAVIGVVTFKAIRLRGPRFKPRQGQKFENENFCFRRTPAVVKACHPFRMRPIKTPLYKT